MVEKLAEMTVDEFFEHGFDSDVLDEEEEEEKELSKNTSNEKDKKGVKKESKSGKHKSQMESLKEKDPEFYKFLQENDEELLAFSGSDLDDDNEEEEDLDEEEEEDEEDEEEDEDKDDDAKKTSKKDKVKEYDDDNSEEEGDDGKETDEESEEELEEGIGKDDEEEEEVEKDNVRKGRKVTSKMVERWKAGLEKDSIKSLKCVFRAFRAAVDKLSPEDETSDKKQKKEKSVYLVETGSMYNTLMKMCLKHSTRILDKNLSPAKQKKFTSTHLPSSHKLWSSVKGALKQYLHDIIQLLRVHTDVSVLTILLRHCQGLCPYYACFPKISKMLLKRLIRMWSSGEEHVRVLAFLCLRSLSFLLPKLYEFIIKKLYLGFVRNSKFVNLKTKPTIAFMKNSLVEMFAYNEAAAYKHGFLYIRQLAITLRNAITVKKKDAYQSVYNWQYISALQLWSQVVSDIEGDVLKPLVYPVVQINLGVIKLIPAARYYPLRFHCIESLNYVSRKAGVYIPTAAFVLQALESKEFLRKPISSEKPPDFSGVLKLSKSQLRSKGFQDCTIDLALELLLEHYVIFSHSIAFPELIFPICHRLKRLIKSCKIFKLGKDMKMLVDKLQAHADTMNKLRDQVTFSPKNIEEVRKWEEERKATKSNLAEFLDTWKNMKKLTGSSQTHNEELEIPAKKVKDKGNKKRKANNKETSETQATKKKKSKPEKQHKFDDNENDIVEDFELSDDDE